MLDDLHRKEEDVSTRLRAPTQFDEECALVSQLDEQGHLMGIDEVIGSFTNELDVEAKCERVYALRN